jgi:hypothetical protein
VRGRGARELPLGGGHHRRTGVIGLVGAPRTAEGAGELDHTGLRRTVRIDGALVNLDEIVRCTLHRPQVVGSLL